MGGDIIENCYNTGNISSIGWYVGGIASGHGNNKTTVRNCYNTGNIQGGQAGGILGVNGELIENCYNIGDINGREYAGGITRGVTEIKNCYNIGEISGSRVGGIASSISNTAAINKCYYLKTEKTTQAVNGIEDSMLDVVQCTSPSEITAEILNANISTIEHEDEWKAWKAGEKGYPVFE